MSGESVLNVVFSFLGGGVIVAVANWVGSVRSERRARHAAMLRDQVNNLYGPLYYLTSQNAELFKLTHAINSAYKAEYIDKKYADAAMPRVRESADRTLEVSNRYIAAVDCNNRHIRELLSSAYAYIDPEDATMFSQFLADELRRETEWPDGRLLTPFEIHQRLGDLPFMRPGFIERSQQQFEAKRAELKRYAGAR